MRAHRGNPLREQAEAEAVDLIRVHGSRAAQCVVDKMQAAVRAGQEAEARKQERILRRVEALLNERKHDAGTAASQFDAE